VVRARGTCEASIGLSDCRIKAEMLCCQRPLVQLSSNFICLNKWGQLFYLFSREMDQLGVPPEEVWPHGAWFAVALAGAVGFAGIALWNYLSAPGATTKKPPPRSETSAPSPKGALRLLNRSCLSLKSTQSANLPSAEACALRPQQRGGGPARCFFRG
jgi:hypothetical protein